MVCHGGYGSVLGALAHGVPLVALPIFAGDQWRNARRVDDLGAGIALEGTRDAKRRMLDGPDPQALGNLPDAIDAVLHDPGYGRAARDLAEAIAALTPVNAAADLLRAIAAQRTLAPRA